MKRSVGVTAAAVVLLLGSALLALVFIVSLATAILPSRISPQISQPGPVSATASTAVGTVFSLLLAGWGIVTAVGILRLRPWARISLMVVSIMAIFVNSMGIVTMFTLLPAMAGPLDPRTLLISRVMMLGIFGIPGTIAAWWLVLFTRPRVKQQFAAEASDVEQAVAPIELLPARSRQTRPVSITVISVVLMAAAGGLGLMIPIYRLVWPIGFPALILGIRVTGYEAVLFYVAFGLLEVALGLGLWWMKPWAWAGTIAFCVFSLVNGAAMALRPATLVQMIAEINAANGVPPSFALPPAFFQAMFVLAVAPVLVALCFLLRNKPAFRPSPAAL
jgi:hypothetical protein